MYKRSEAVKNFILVFSMFLFIFFVPLVSSAQPQTTTNLDVGYNIFYPDFSFVPQNSEFYLHTHIFNKSNGMPLYNTEASCYLHLYNSTGQHTFESGKLGLDSNRYDYEIYITKGNFSDLGTHAFLIWCNSSAFGGEVRGTFDVTLTGKDLTPGMSILYFLVTIFAFLIFFLLCWIFLNINGENPKDETGYLGINYRKYIKTAMFPLVYVSFLWAFNFIIGLSQNYLGLTLYVETMGFIFMILTKLVYPIIALCVIIAIVLMVKDTNIEKEYKSLWSRF